VIDPAPRRVLVLRALVLGDLLCATPALRALRQGWPGAEITLLGLPWAQALAERLPSVDRFVAFPGWPGFPEAPTAGVAERGRFVREQQAQGYDLALQLHGSGERSNRIVAALKARRNAGFAGPGVWLPPRDAACFVPWPTAGSEAQRLLALTDHLGLPPQTEQLDFPLTDGDRADATALLSAAAAPGARGGAADRPLVLVHAGSQLPSRRWPVERFAAVADGLADAGCAIALTGTAAEAPLVQRLRSAMRAPALDLAGRTSLWTLGALVEHAALVLANDTGISHVAAALGTPSVIVASGSDVARWAPADGARHRVHWHDVPCRPCGHAECPYDHACATGVAVQPVLADALRAIGTARGRAPAPDARQPNPSDIAHA
jgi:ADP-heptose:LPS heptosyltransferase